MAEEAQTPEIVDDVVDTQLETPAIEEDGEEEIPTFGDTLEESQDTDNATIRHLRDKLKEAHREAAELRRSVPASQPVEIGPEPSLWDAGIDGDETKLRDAIRQYDREVADAEKSKTTAQQTAAEAQKAWETKLSKVAEEKAALAKPDVDDAFDTVRAALGDDRFAGLLGIVDDGNSAKFVYALSKNPDQLEALSSQTDPIKLIKEITRLEGQLKMIKRRAAPSLDTPERGSGRLSKPGPDKELERLEKEAERTRDRTKVQAYKRKLREARQS